MEYEISNRKQPKVPPEVNQASPRREKKASRAQPVPAFPLDDRHTEQQIRPADNG